ncbi:putative arabinosyltransferase ARAD1 [Cinnamomum micranthum f. kanehirae]|uniref:Putative arabinosyltransferase ARAD1 n=1 Tax=Cinnamomum micranthum f. kanehirae TaxID=337451 RepID=A0A3S4NB25_9MAGN|nr:putative arabinosyltransferase ARAD1 [Cinnamomum micranthum f. kanehirae]
MAVRNASSHGLVTRSYLFFLFTVVSLVLFSGVFFFLLGSTGNQLFIYQSLLANPKILAMTNNGSSPSPNQNRFHPPTSKSSFLLDEDGSEEIQKCNPDKAVLKVFMYDLPPEFHFGMLDWKGKKNGVWPDIRSVVPHHPGGLNLQHSIEYWLTLDLLSSRFPDRPGPCTAVRVESSKEADVVFVPFFSSLSYNRHSKPHKTMSRDKLLQEKLVEFLAAQKEWRRSGGRDHVIMAHHPNSMLDARMKLWPALFIIADFGRYPPNIANVNKDVVAPYNHVIRTFVNDSSGFDSRPTLLYFQGAIYRKDGGIIRQELFYLLKDEEHVHFSFGSVRADGIRNASQGMHLSKFCLNIAGDTPSSNRLFDAIVSHCVPVIISDEIELPYEDVLDYSEFCIFVRTSDALKKGFLVNLIRSIGRDEWTRMWKRLKEIEHHFEFQYPSQKDDAVQMIWQAVARRVPAIRLKVHRSRRFSRRFSRSVNELKVNQMDPTVRKILASR